MKINNCICGNKPKIRYYNIDHKPISEMYCDKCGLKLPIETNMESDAIEAWNKAMNPKLEKWILTNQKLPWDDTDVIVTIYDDSGDTPWSYTSKGFYISKGECWIVDNEIHHDIIAWMPLPEPYREDKK